MMTESNIYKWDNSTSAGSTSGNNAGSLLDKLGSAQTDKLSAATSFNALDQIDPDLGSIISSLSAHSNNNPIALSANNFDDPADLIDGRRNSAGYAGSDVDSEFGPFGFRRGTLSLGGFNQNGGANQTSRLQGNSFGTSASVSGGIPSSHSAAQSSGRFLEKFSAVAEATREVELLGGGLGSLSINSPSGRVPSSTSRRTSFLAPESSQSLSKQFSESSPNSLNESLNNPLNSTSTRQSISEKIDNYNLSNSNSPEQQFKTGSASATVSRAMSVSSDVRSEHNSMVLDVNDKVNATNIWNTQSAANATSFTPMFNQPQLQPMNTLPPQGFGFNPYGFPPFGFMPMMPPQFQGNMQQMGPNPTNGQQQEQQQQIPQAPLSQSLQPGISQDSAGSQTMDSSLPNSANLEGNNVVLNPQPQQAPPSAPMGFNPGSPSPPFMYAQAFSPFGFIPPQLNDPNNTMNSNNSSSQPPSFHSKRNNRFTKSTSPNNNAGTRENGGSRGNGSSGNREGKSKPQIYRSPLLEEFRNNVGNKDYQLKDIYGNAIEFSKDQHGSRFIQEKLGSSSEEEKETIFNEIYKVAIDLTKDVFGNYVIQKFFEYGSDTQKQVLLGEMKGKIETLSFQMYGCRVVQRAIEFVGLDDQVSIIAELKDSVVRCIKDQNGNHVIQKSIERIPIENLGFILDSMRSQIYPLSTHPYGCRVIQRLLEYSNEEDQQFILSELKKFTYYLIQDQYGNYVIQHIIEFGKPKERETVVEVVSKSVVEFSKHKFASNVVERCVMFGDESQRSMIFDEVMKGNEKDDNSQVDDNSALGLMMKDQFANYVVQKLVDVTKGQKKKVLIKKIKQYLKQISKSSYGKHLASIEKLILLAETADISDDEN